MGDLLGLLVAEVRSKVLVLQWSVAKPEVLLCKDEAPERKSSILAKVLSIGNSIALT